MANPQPCVLAIDVGTSSLKAVVYGGLGAVLALVTAAPRAVGWLTCSLGSSSMVYYPLYRQYGQLADFADTVLSKIWLWRTITLKTQGAGYDRKN